MNFSIAKSMPNPSGKVKLQLVMKFCKILRKRKIFADFGGKNAVLKRFFWIIVGFWNCVFSESMA